MLPAKKIEANYFNAENSKRRNAKVTKKNFVVFMKNFASLRLNLNLKIENKNNHILFFIHYRCANDDKRQ
jgi:hypothetical protein